LGWNPGCSNWRAQRAPGFFGLGLALDEGDQVLQQVRVPLGRGLLGRHVAALPAVEQIG